MLFAEGLIDEAFMRDHVAFGVETDASKTLDDHRRFLADYAPAKVAESTGTPAR